MGYEVRAGPKQTAPRENRHMINFKPYASGSKGNLYAVDDGKTKILVECGLPWKTVQRLLGFKTSEFAGCLLTHGHADHSKAVADLMHAGMDVYTSRGTINHLGLDECQFRVIESKKQFKIGTWTILPFDTEHDIDGPLGFLLANEYGEKLLFATDTFYLKYKFSGLSIVAVECNYATDILAANVEAGRLPESQKNRLLKSHFSLANVKEFLKANDLSKVVEIHLLHLSDGNSDAARFKREIMELTGKPVYVAAGGGGFESV